MIYIYILFIYFLKKKKIKILKRDKDVGIKEREQNEIKRNVITTTKSLAEREEEYRRARLRIFGN